MHKHGNEENYRGRNTNGPVSHGAKARILMRHVPNRERPGDKNENEPQRVVNSDRNPHNSSKLHRRR